MRQEMILKNIESPSISNVRKALRALSKQIDVIDEKELENLISKIAGRLAEMDDRTKLILLATLRRIIERKPSKTPMVTDLIKEFLNTEEPTVRATSIQFVRYLISNNIVEPTQFDLKEIVEANIGGDNLFVVSSSLDLLKVALERNLLEADPYLDRIVEIYLKVDKREILEKTKYFVVSLFDKLSKELKDSVVNRSEKLTKSPSTHVREISLDVIHFFVEKEVIDGDMAILITKRALRDPKPAVKLKALNLFRSLIDKYPKESYGLLEIIVKEILLGNVNKKTKLEVLKVIQEVIDKIPRDIIYRYDLHRALDIIEKNTIPKSPLLQQIKDLSRSILEEKLNLTLEKRRHLKK